MFTRSKIDVSPDEIIMEKLNIDATFMDLINTIKTRYPKQLKVVYAYLESSENIDDMHQYLIVFTQVQKDKKTGKPITLYACMPALRFGRACLEVFSICKRKGWLDTFFKEFFQNVITFEERKFNYFITQTCELSTNKDSKEYWKSPDNAHTLIDTLSEMGSIYESVIRNKNA